MMISCRDAAKYISEKQHEKLSSWVRFKLWLHLAMCKVCKHYGKQITAIHQHLKRLKLTEKVNKKDLKMKRTSKEQIKKEIANQSD